MYGTFRYHWGKPGKSTKKSELFAQKSFGRNDERIPTLFQLERELEKVLREKAKLTMELEAVRANQSWYGGGIAAPV